MRQKTLLILTSLLLIEGYLLFLSIGVNPTGRAGWVSLETSGAGKILLTAFILTLVSILFSIKFLHDPKETDDLPDESKISTIYAVESLELHKGKSEIRNDLEKKGYSDKEIEAFLNHWEKEEDEVRIPRTGHKITKKN